MLLIKCTISLFVVLMLSTTIIFAEGIDDIIFGLKQTLSIDTIYHLFGIIGVGIWANQARKTRIGNLSLLFLISLGVSCLMGMSINFSFDMRPIIAGEIIVLGVLIGRCIGLTSAWDVGAIMIFGLLHGVILGSLAQGKAPMFYPLGVVLSGVILLMAGTIITWVLGIQKLNSNASRYHNAPFVGGILTGAGVTIMIWFLR
jgi:hydrogenase/urease accessory protein HupE